ncbi:heparinase II/III family protein [Solirubrobacter soli]|uniref:heparinase II/III family protein n=1 Tax=Solirubrobacter soli TaxID=363832 RepID=UPI000427AAFE|nr:alginate lyase family protein [Solirubrobacter soli]
MLCVNEHEHRDRALADAVACGVFSFHGETRELGLEPDWLDRAPLPPDEEWRLDWVKFYYGLDLADAFRATGDRRYLVAWERLVASFILQVAPEHDPSEVTARRVLNWIYAWQRLPETTIGPELVESVREQARHVRNTLTAERNHRTLELYALLITALALGDDTDFAVAELHANLLADFGEDGVHRERSTHYHMIALRSFVGARENGRRFGIPFSAAFDERLARARDFAHHMRRPDGTIPALSDSDTGDYSELLQLAERLLGPAGDRTSFVAGGYFIQRAGERFLIFDCGPLGDGGHGHYDALSVEAWAGERALVLDPGRFTYAEGSPNLRHWFRGTAAHNTVCVDGHDQTPYARSRSSLPSAEATFLGRDVRDGLDVLYGEVVSPVYEAVHRRRVIFVDGAYWLIEDVLTGSVRHRYDLRWHLAPKHSSFTLHVKGARSVALEDGWISPRYGSREAAPVVSAVAVGETARFVTLLAPDLRVLEVDGDVARVGGDTIVLGERVTRR